jgi:preprotein translocase subunit SecE
MDSEKYIGDVALEIADTMWPSRLCRVAAPHSGKQALR